MKIRWALEILSEAIMKIDEELGLDAVAADDRLVIRALIRHATAIRRWPMEGRSGDHRRSRRRGLQGSRGFPIY